MFRRYFLASLVLGLALLIDVSSAEAGRPRLFQRFRPTQQTNVYRSNSSSKLHMTHSRSAILDGFFRPGGVGYDRSWYVGK